MTKRQLAVAVCSLVLANGCNCTGEASFEDGGIEDGGTTSLETDAGPSTVSVTVTVTGAGAVEVDGASCTLDAGQCAVTRAPGTVTLRAVASAGYRFGGWVCGETTSAEETLVVDVASDLSCHARFVRTTGSLTVEVTDGDGGTGGVVTSSVGAIACGTGLTSCVAELESGTGVALTARADPHDSFVGWAGDCQGEDAGVFVVVAGDTRCVARFRPEAHVLTVVASPHGQVRSRPEGIDLGADGGTAEATYAWGTAVTLSGAPEPHYEATYGGDCTDAGVVVMEGARACRVDFALVKETLTVTPVGSGSVVSAPSGVDTAAGALSGAFAWGTAVTLTASPNTGGGQQVSFLGWSGDCSGTAATAAVVMDDAKACIATFTVTPYDLTVAVTPAGGGAVTGKVDGAGPDVISCGGGGTDCGEAQVPSSHSVTLVATPAAGYRFLGWSGCSASTAATLSVPMTADKACTASFVRQWTVRVAALTGPGSVTVDRSSTGAGVDTTCTAAGCAVAVDGTETVAVTAVPANATAVVESFTCTAGTRTGATYTVVNPTGDVTCSVAFRQQYAVGVTVTGAGGTVASNPAGLLGCSASGGTCSALFLSGAAVALTATPAANVQATWGAAGGGTCDGVVSDGPGQAKVMTFASLNGAKSCLVAFTPVQVTVQGVAGANGSVTPATSTVTSGGAGVTLTATPAANHHLGTWSGAFTSGSGTATGCTGSAATVTVAISGATSGAVYACTATFAANTVTLSGVATPPGSGSVTPASSTVTSGGAGVTLTASPNTGQRLLSWSGAFTSGSGTASGCAGSAGAVTVSVSGATHGAVYVCTAAFVAQAVVTVRVVPAPSATTTFGVVTSPCTISAGSASCTAPVDVNSVVTLTTAEVKSTSGANVSRFVRWVCTDGTTSTARTATLTVSGATTCVAQYYGLWSRYYSASTTGQDAFPNLAPLAPGTSQGLPTSSSTVLVDGLDLVDNAYSFAGLVAADDEAGGPLYTDRARPFLGGLSARTSFSGTDAPALVGYVFPATGRTRGVFGPYQVGRGPNGAVTGLTRGTFRTYAYADPGPIGQTSFTYDTWFLGGAQSPSGAHALAGFRALGVHYVTGSGTVSAYQNSAWVVLTTAAGVASSAAAFLVPSAHDGTTCLNPYVTSVNGVLWDPDTTGNPGGVVVVGQYAPVGSCTTVSCAGVTPLYGFIAKLSSQLAVLSMRLLVPSDNLPSPSFSAKAVVDNLGHTGYVVFGERRVTSVAGLETVYVGAVALSYDLRTMGRQAGFAAVDSANGTTSSTTFNDVLVDATGRRYLALATAAFGDVVVMSFDSTGSPIATEGWQFGSATLAESGLRIISAPEGGFVFSGQGPTATRGPLNFWVTRTDEGFNVPFNGTAPGDRRVTPLAYAPTISLSLVDSAPFTCATMDNSPFVDGTIPTQATATTVHTAFNPALNIQAP